MIVIVISEDKVGNKFIFIGFLKLKDISVLVVKVDKIEVMYNFGSNVIEE